MKPFEVHWSKAPKATNTTKKTIYHLLPHDLRSFQWYFQRKLEVRKFIWHVAVGYATEQVTPSHSWRLSVHSLRKQEVLLVSKLLFDLLGSAAITTARLVYERRELRAILQGSLFFIFIPHPLFFPCYMHTSCLWMSMYFYVPCIVGESQLRKGEMNHFQWSNNLTLCRPALIIHLRQDKVTNPSIAINIVGVYWSYEHLTGWKENFRYSTWNSKN